MSFDDPKVRQAFVRGVRATYLSVAFHIPVREQKALETWLAELDTWHCGDPPTAPEPWKALLP